MKLFIYYMWKFENYSDFKFKHQLSNRGIGIVYIKKKALIVSRCRTVSTPHNDLVLSGGFNPS